MRLDKYLAEAGISQRKQVRSLIQSGKVSVNGAIIYEAAYEVNLDHDIVCYENDRVKYTGKRYIMFHKPSGCITARSDERHKTVLDYFSKEERAGLFPVGRLDKDTEGLLLLTNDGEFDYQLMNPKHHVAKTYYFIALGTIDEMNKKRIQEGVSIDGENSMTAPAKLTILKSGYCDEFPDVPIIWNEIISDRKLQLQEKKYRKPVVIGELTITEGKKHQVKRMLRAVGCFVIYLKRISIGDVDLDPTLKLGEYRDLNENEIIRLQSYKD